jgi:catalase
LARNREECFAEIEQAVFGTAEHADGLDLSGERCFKGVDSFTLIHRAAEFNKAPKKYSNYKPDIDGEVREAIDTELEQVGEIIPPSQRRELHESSKPRVRSIRTIG